jgi:hypothetical protein
MCIKCSYIVLVLNITNAKTTFSVASLKDVPHLCMYSTCKTKFNHENQIYIYPQNYTLSLFKRFNIQTPTHTLSPSSQNSYIHSTTSLQYLFIVSKREWYLKNRQQTSYKCGGLPARSYKYGRWTTCSSYYVLTQSTWSSFLCRKPICSLWSYTLSFNSKILSFQFLLSILLLLKESLV